ncbi:hypothetical protein IRZ71_05590 [Flavobacterium sp. ANB]|uniref:hypothetical protein n=1 Tax=unclassified Flavobacterium TaxID=196869 RepID=UPI0012B869C9|nr:MULTISPECIES: hypothetical protein [unclassified Flavobacterium]MBF4515803.1 hypothetical protein [Flavobacterium sp. ANB]MTD68806.1 hypothetical protein [Flavobacterium sp. LC2016-13]
MKAENKQIEPSAWTQLTDKIKEVDRMKKQSNMLLQQQIDSILGNKKLKINVPKNFKETELFKTKPC